jgi:hypothetical protein
MNMPAGQGVPPVVHEIPDLKKLDLQMLMQDNAAARREVHEARRETQKRLEEERDRSRYEIERVRAEIGEKLKRADRENDALIIALGRLREENDALRQENIVLKIGRNGYPAAETREQEMRPSAIPMPMAVGPVGSGPTVPIAPFPGGPVLGKTLLVEPPKL